MATPFTKKLSTTALDQYDRYHLLREQQDPLATQIGKYWTDLGMAFPGVATAWSAVFVSWCVKKAGATAAQFQFAAAHARFVHKAIANQTAGVGVFRAHPPDAYAPKVGDIVHNNRSGNTFNYAFAKTHSAYESHSAIVIEVGADTTGRYLRTIGGNEGDSVGQKEIRLNSAGIIRNPSPLYISVIETLL